MDSKLFFIAILSFDLLLFGCLGQPSKDQCATMNCDDNNSCTADTCTAGVCKNTPIADDTVCGANKTCKSGVCTTVAAPTLTNCSTNESCFYTNLASCSPAKFEIDFETQGIQKFQITIKGQKDNQCSVETLVTTHIMPEFIGTKMTCAVPQNATTKESYIREFNPIGASVLTSCSGTYVDAIKKAFGG